MAQQNTIALIFDSDLTLTPYYMQKVIFDEYGIEGKEFWEEKRSYIQKIKESNKNKDVQDDIAYLNLILRYVKDGKFPGLNDKKLRELGANLEFYPGIPDFFDRINSIINHKNFKKHEINIEVYIITSGIAEIIRGSAIAGKVKQVYGCEFLEGEGGEIEEIISVINGSEKTRCLYEINKGPKYDVNTKLKEENKRIPFRNIIYVADGSPSDIPAFAVVKGEGGHCVGVYHPDKTYPHFKAIYDQMKRLNKERRVECYGPANYSEGTSISIDLEMLVKEIAENIAITQENILDQKPERKIIHMDS